MGGNSHLRSWGPEPFAGTGGRGVSGFREPPARLGAATLFPQEVLRRAVLAGRGPRHQEEVGGGAPPELQATRSAFRMSCVKCGTEGQGRGSGCETSLHNSSSDPSASSPCHRRHPESQPDTQGPRASSWDVSSTGAEPGTSWSVTSRPAAGLCWSPRSPVIGACPAGRAPTPTPPSPQCRQPSSLFSPR